MMLINSVPATPVTSKTLEARAARAAKAKEAARKRHPLITSFRLTDVRHYSYDGVYTHIEATLCGFDVFYTEEEGGPGYPTREDLCLRLRRNPNPEKLEGYFRFLNKKLEKGENNTPFDIAALREAMWGEAVIASF